MFNQTVHILNAEKVKVGTISADVQPYSQTYTYEGGYSLDLTKRLFCDRVSSITLDSYIKINDELHKVIYINTWSDYLEVWLYESQQPLGDGL